MEVPGNVTMEMLPSKDTMIANIIHYYNLIFQIYKCALNSTTS